MTVPPCDGRITWLFRGRERWHTVPLRRGLLQQWVTAFTCALPVFIVIHLCARSTRHWLQRFYRSGDKRIFFIAATDGLNEEMATRSPSPRLNLLLVEPMDRPELVNRYVGDFFKSAEPVHHEDFRPLWLDLQDSNEQALRRLVRSVHRVSVEGCSFERPTNCSAADQVDVCTGTALAACL